MEGRERGGDAEWKGGRGNRRDLTMKSQQTKILCFFVRTAVAAWLADREMIASSPSTQIWGT